MRNVFYFKSINSVGGCESFFWYLSKKYDFEVYYRVADPEQIKRLSQNVECHKYKKPIKCDKFFCCYGYDINVDSPIKKHIIHCDYKQVKFKPIQYDGFEYIGVSQLACDSFKELTGKNAELIYNPVFIDKPNVKKYNDGKLHLISATRLSPEKGLERMQKLASLLDKAGIDYEWVVYTNRIRKTIGRNVVYKQPSLDIIEEIAKADYLVQLSDCESYCYSIVEALLTSVPVICTNLPVLKELGVIHGKNAVICDMNMTNVDINMIKKKDFNFKYEPPISTWNKYLSTDKKYNPNDLIPIKVLRGYTDIELGEHFIRNQDNINGKPIMMTKARASYLESKGLVERCD